MERKRKRKRGYNENEINSSELRVFHIKLLSISSVYLSSSIGFFINIQQPTLVRAFNSIKF